MRPVSMLLVIAVLYFGDEVYAAAYDEEVYTLVTKLRTFNPCSHTRGIVHTKEELEEKENDCKAAFKEWDDVLPYALRTSSCKNAKHARCHKFIDLPYPVCAVDVPACTTGCGFLGSTESKVMYLKDCVKAVKPRTTRRTKSKP
ncbi:unnamed protein product [Bemisia tabaci]|uniref:Secreted protein n=1 Tax=Bemisia tabaci TaxID=7038 RepID=A0A9P0CDK5_BEMTA|nr:unnamed protein product [Bemisia tabaci]